jgi:uncharacterized protein YtpQ (UPF0354 family)
MEARLIRLKAKEKKALAAIVEMLKNGETMMRERAAIVNKFRPKMWTLLLEMYPAKENEIDRSYDYETGELRFFVSSEMSKYYRILKEWAIKDSNWQKVEYYRDLEKKEKKVK